MTFLNPFLYSRGVSIKILKIKSFSGFTEALLMSLEGENSNFLFICLQVDWEKGAFAWENLLDIRDSVKSVV